MDVELNPADSCAAAPAASSAWSFWPITCGGHLEPRGPRSVQADGSGPCGPTTRHNPVRMLMETSDANLAALAKDPTFLRQYDAVLMEMGRDLGNGHHWFAQTYPQLRGEMIAYLSAEFGGAWLAAHLFRRPGHSLRRSQQRGQRSGVAVHWRGVSVRAGVLLAAPGSERLAGSHLSRTAAWQWRCCPRKNFATTGLRPHQGGRRRTKSRCACGKCSLDVRACT